MAHQLTSLKGINYRNTVVTIGSFDGVHLGHQHLIQELKSNALSIGSQSVVLTFHPHPTVILRGRKGAFYLTTVQEKVSLLDRLGVDVIITHPFTYELSQSSATDFVDYLVEHLGFSQLWIGQDFALGKGREGNVDFLRRLGQSKNFEINVVNPVIQNGRVISSSLIRSLLTEGKVDEANSLLGRLYQITGVVVHGDGRGKSIGIPTANLNTGDEKLVPGAGVYACRAILDGQVLPAAVNIGTRPTFDSSDMKSHVEAHILDYFGDIYDKSLSIEFVSRLRGEEKFASVEELISQIHEDIKRTREIILDSIKAK